MSWIKLETHTFDKVEIYSIAQELGIDPDAVVGKCCRVWAWFDANTTDSVTPSVTKALLDRYCSVTSFCDSMIKHGWMIEADGFISLPNHDRHNSKTAKSRALGAIRQSKFKESQNSVTPSVTPSVTKALPKSSHREEKRREDIKNSKKTLIPIDFSITDELRVWAKSKDINNLDDHLEHFISTCKAKGYTYLDWHCAFQNAVRKDWATIGHGTKHKSKFVPA